MAKKHILTYAKYLLLGAVLTVFPTRSFAVEYKNLALKLTASIAEMYDDNLLFTKDDKQDDYITTLALGMNTKYESKRRTLVMSGQANYRFNANNQDIKNNSENASISFQNNFTDYDGIGLRYAFSHSYTPETYQEELERVSGRRQSFKHNFSTNYMKSLSERFNVNVKYSYALSEFSGEDTSNFSSSRAGLDTNYLAGNATTFVLSYNYGKNNSNNEIHNANIGIVYKITQKSNFDGRVGWDISIADNTKNENIFFDILFNSEIDENSSASIAYSKGEQFNSEEGSVSSNWQVNGSLAKRLLERLRSSFSCFYGEDTSVGGSRNTLIGANFSLSYELLEDTQVDLRYAFSDLYSTDEDAGYARNTVTLNLSRSF